eukprot:5741480-Pyramimonas_sp.AAC.1
MLVHICLRRPDLEFLAPWTRPRVRPVQKFEADAICATRERPLAPKGWKTQSSKFDARLWQLDAS